MFKVIKIIFLILFSTAFLLVGSSLFVPVSWLAKQDLIKGVAPEQLQGYWWRGSLQNSSLRLQGHEVELELVSWDHDWRSLLSLQFCSFVVARGDQAGADGKACFEAPKVINFEDVSLKFLAVELADITGLEIAGSFEAYAESMQIANQELIFLRADALWQFAQFHNGEKWIELGEISIALDKAMDDGPLLTHWTSFSSPAVIDIKTYYEKNGSGKIAGFIEPDKLQDSSFIETLELFSQRRIDQPLKGARYIFNYQF